MPRLFQYIFLLITAITGAHSFQLHAQNANIPLSAWQESGEPFIQNFSPKEYGGNFQNWCVDQDSNGIVYFANNDGLLTYDGVSWRIHEKTKAPLMRSLAIGEDGLIYGGFQSDFGYYSPDSIGDLKFTSLKHLVDSTHRDFYDFWFTKTSGDTVYFMAEQVIFRWANQKLDAIKPTTHVTHMFKIGNRMFFRQGGYGLSYLDGDTLRVVPNGKLASVHKSPFLLHPYDDNSLLIGTYGLGLYKFDYETIEKLNTTSTSYLRKNRIYTFAPLARDLLAIGTQFGGLVIINNEGELLKIIDKSYGLQDNSVWYVHRDNQGGLWLGLNNGISRVEFPGPLTRFSAISNLNGIVNDIKRHDSKIYAATSEGIFSLDHEEYEVTRSSTTKLLTSPPAPTGQKTVFRHVEPITLYSFSLFNDGNHLLAGTSNGVFRISGDAPKQILEGISGGWQSVFEMCRSVIDTNRLYMATRKGIGILKMEDNEWRSAGWIKDFKQKSYLLIEDADGSLWVNTAEKGIFHISDIASEPVDEWKFPATISHYDTAHGLPDEEDINPIRVSDTAYFLSNHIAWRFQPSDSSFIPDSTFHSGEMVGKEWGYYGQVDDQQRIWVSTKFKPGVENIAVGIPRPDGTYDWESRQFSRIRDASEILNIYPESSGSGEDIIWVGSDNIYRYDPRFSHKFEGTNTARIRRVTVNNDSVVFHGYGPMPVQRLPYNANTIQFDFALPAYDASAENLYQTCLEGFDRKWSNWSVQTQRNYTNLPEGQYRFRVKAQNIYAQLSEEAVYTFSILPPWYRTWWAFLGYTLFTLSAIVAIVYFTNRWRIHQLKQRNLQLEETVAARTKKLRRQAEEILRRQKQLIAQEKLASLGQLTAGIAHEIKNPLNFINNFAELSLEMVEELKEDLERLLPQLPAEEKENFDEIIRDLAQNAAKIKHHGTRADSIVSGMLQHSRGKSGSFQPTDINAMLEEYTNLSFHSMRARDANFNVDIKQDLDARIDKISAVPQDLSRAISNILNNSFEALKARDDKAEKTFVGEIAISTVQQNGAVEIRIRDNGGGISKDIREQIFIPFFTTKPTGQGHPGLGLSISHDIIVKIHHGTLEIDSDAVDWSEAVITIPLKITE